ncbi:late embryogenesis abundant protein Lea5 [Dendrobium catenatum]|uniref:late embryogenesis abundant protein Lea5 n=1 Tax=Dendrobium catenatum TaxID=906689 RepID=UPI0009F1EB9E|nr:late embryogenesis abundant protein Lea5 [Dendrobium catenatum]
MARAFLFATVCRAFICQKRRLSSAAALVTKGQGRATESAPKKNSDTKVVVASDVQNPSTTAWMPDPVTGYYGPANRQKEIDAAEMRGRLFSRK